MLKAYHYTTISQESANFLYNSSDNIPKMAPAAINVLNKLITIDNHSPLLYPSQSYLGEAVGVSREHVNRVIKELHDEGYIIRQNRGMKQTCLYFLNPHFLNPHVRIKLTPILWGLKFERISSLNLHLNIKEKQEKDNLTGDITQYNNIINNYSTTTTNTTILIRARDSRWTENEAKMSQKENEMNVSKELFTKYGVEATAHGEIYFKYVPKEAIEFALKIYSQSKGIKSIGRFVGSEIRKYMASNNINPYWGLYFKELEGNGVDRNSEILVAIRKVEQKSRVALEKKIEILTTDPDSELKSKLSRVEKVIMIGKRKIEAFAQLKEDRPLTAFEELELNSEEELIKQRLGMQLKYCKQLEQNKALRDELSLLDISQAEKDYRLLNLKIERDSKELSNWRRILDNVDTKTHPSFKEETIKMSNLKIKQYTKSLAKDLEELNRIDLLRQKPVSDNSSNQVTISDVYEAILEQESDGEAQAH